MGVSPDLLQSENLTQVGRVVERDVPLLIERWRAQVVASQPNARRLHHQALQDDLPRFLTELGRCLAESEERNAGLHCKPAQDHGEQRWEAGWSLVEVVRDYQILRLVLTDHLEAVHST